MLFFETFLKDLYFKLSILTLVWHLKGIVGDTNTAIGSQPLLESERALR